MKKFKYLLGIFLVVSILFTGNSHIVSVFATSLDNDY